MTSTEVDEEVERRINNIKISINQIKKHECDVLQMVINPLLVNYKLTNFIRASADPIKFPKLRMPSSAQIEANEFDKLEEESSNGMNEDLEEELYQGHNHIDREKLIVHTSMKDVIKKFEEGMTAQEIGSANPGPQIYSFNEELKKRAEIETKYLASLATLEVKKDEIIEQVTRERNKRRQMVIEFNEQRAKCSKIFYTRLSNQVIEPIKDILLEQRFKKAWNMIASISSQSDGQGVIYHQAVEAIQKYTYDFRRITIHEFFTHFDYLCTNAKVSSEHNSELIMYWFKEALVRSGSQSIKDIITIASHTDKSMDMHSLREKLVSNEIKFNNSRNLKRMIGTAQNSGHEIHMSKHFKRHDDFETNILSDEIKLNLSTEKKLCSHCNRPNHSEKECWIKHPQLKPKKFNNKKVKSVHFQIGDVAKRNLSKNE